MGPCVVGVRLGADTTSSKVTSWSAGINYNRMVADDGPGAVERLNGQQVRDAYRCPPATMVCFARHGAAVLLVDDLLFIAPAYWQQQGLPWWLDSRKLPGVAAAKTVCHCVHRAVFCSGVCW